MHELSICTAIADAVRDKADGRQVVSVQLQVGHLRQIVVESLEFCWTMVSDRPPLTGARLDIEHIPAVIECSDCGERSVLEHPIMACPACSGGLVNVVAGQEFMITSIELITPDDDGPSGPEER